MLLQLSIITPTWQAVVSSPLQVQGRQIQANKFQLLKEVVLELLDHHLVRPHQLGVVSQHAADQGVHTT